MAKKYKFDLTVDSTALLQANPTEFYSRLYGMETASSNYRVLPGIKNKTKIANVLFDQVTQDAACDFAATDATVSAIEVDVCPLMLNASVCQYELEQSWLATEMAQGSNSDFSVASFMAYFWEQMANKAHEEFAKLAWQGDADGETSSFLDLCDGWLKRLCGLSPIRVEQATVTSDNVITQLGAVMTALPNEVVVNAGSGLQFKVSPNVATAYRIATAATNTINNVTQSLGLTFLDVPIVVEYGLPSNTIILSSKDNFVFVTDLEGDIDSLEVVDFSKTTLDRRIGARADYKAGFYITNDEQIVLHGACTAS
jgi:hypothetical protein